MRRITLSTLAFELAALLFTFGCGGGTQPPAASSLQSRSTSTTTTATTPTFASVFVTPYRSTLGATQVQKFVSTVSNAATAAVDWTISDCTGECGTITSDGVYTAPPFVSDSTWVVIHATLQADTNIFGIAYVNLLPVQVVISPSATVRLAANADRSFDAVISYDPANQGVTWSLSGTGCSGNACGTLSDARSTSVVYHAPAVAPAPPAVMLKARSLTDANQSAVAGIVVANSTSQYVLEGAYAFLIQGTRAPDVADDYSGGGEVAIAGHINIDSSGNVTGIWDATLQASGGITEPISGNYAVHADGNGTLTLRAESGIWTFALAVQSGGESAALWQDPENPSPLSTISMQSGYLQRQDENTFSMSSVAGDRVLALTFMNVGAIGRLTSDTAGTVSNGVMDLTWQGGYLNFFTTSKLTGSFAAPDPLTGRGTAALTATPGPDAAVENFHFAYYIISDQKMLLVEQDGNSWQFPVLRGEARYQKGAGTFTNASWNAPVIYNLNSDDAGSWFTPFATLGLIRPDGSGSLTETWDNSEQVEGGLDSVITLEASNPGTYSVSADGRVVLSLPGRTVNLYSPHIGVAYLTDTNLGYLIREQLFGTPFGYFEPQTATSFSTAVLAGTFDASIAGPPRTFMAERDAGFITLGNDGSANAFLSLDRGAGLETLNWNGTYTVSGNGRGVMNLTDSATGEQKTIVFWAVSSNRALAIVSLTKDDKYPLAVELRR